MLASGSHSVKAALLKTTGRVAEPGGGTGVVGGSDPYLLHYHGSRLLLGTDPTRSLGRLQALLVQGDLQQLWLHTKQRLKAQLRDACGAYAPQQRLQGQRAAAAAATAASHTVAAAAELEPLYGSNGLMRTAIMYVLAHASRAFMTRANATSVEGGHHMTAALARPPGTPLVTVCNHVASMDDPLVMSTVLPPEAYTDADALRWTLCASDRCFHRQLLVPFFRAAKVLPVQRGAGMFQPGLAAAEARLAAGDWVHIFPEGTRSRDGRMGPVRKGVGRLVASCGHASPVILPFVHSGMEDVLPKGSLLPKTNKQVRVLVGEPIDVSDLLTAASAAGWSDDELYRRIANRIGGRMAALKAQLDGLPLDPAAQAASQQAALDAGLDLYDPADNAHRAATLWERVSFRAQHREWASTGLASAKARLAAAAEAVSGGLSLPQPGELADGLAARARLQLRLARALADDAAQPAAGRAVGGAGPQRPLARVLREWLGRDCSEREYLSRQRAIAMIQLLQARA